MLLSLMSNTRSFKTNLKFIFSSFQLKSIAYEDIDWIGFFIDSYISKFK